MADYQIRQASLQDIDAICLVEKSAFPPHRQASSETLVNRMKLFPEGFYVILYKDKIVGFSTALLTDDLRSLEALNPPDNQLHQPQGNTYYLRSVGIMSEHQRKGFGKALIEKQLENARGLNKKRFCFTASEEVEAFYTHLGFKKLTNYESFHGSIQAVWEMIFI